MYQRFNLTNQSKMTLYSLLLCFLWSVFVSLIHTTPHHTTPVQYIQREDTIIIIIIILEVIVVCGRMGGQFPLMLWSCGCTKTEMYYTNSHIYIYIWINLISLFKLSLRAKVHFLFPYDVPSSLHHHNNFFMS